MNVLFACPVALTNSICASMVYPQRFEQTRNETIQVEGTGAARPRNKLLKGLQPASQLNLSAQTDLDLLNNLCLFERPPDQVTALTLVLLPQSLPNPHHFVRQGIAHPKEKE